MTQYRGLLTILISMFAMVGCGGNGASNNDQGVSVTFLGVFDGSASGAINGTPVPTATPSSAAAGCGDLPTTMLTGAMLNLDQASMIQNGTFLADVGLQNNLQGQFFRADRLLLDYFIAGSSVQPPSTTFALNMLAGPAEAGIQGGAGAQTGGIRRPIVTSLPPSFRSNCNRVFAQVPIIPPAIFEWLAFNRDQLPATPFDMEVVITLTGLSSSGDRYDTNPGAFGIIVTSGGVRTTADVSSNSETSAEGGDEAPPSTLSAPHAGDEDEQGLEELESAFNTESVIEGE